MPISRICQTCGEDLAHALAQREPHYGLLVVRCGRCGTVAPAGVRKAHPLIAGYRLLKRRGAALAWLAFQAAAAGGLTALAAAAGRATAAELADCGLGPQDLLGGPLRNGVAGLSAAERLDYYYRAYGLLMPGVWLWGAVLLGTWARAFLTHLRRVERLLLMVVLLTCAALAPEAAGVLGMFDKHDYDGTITYGGAIRAAEVISGVGVASITLVLAGVGSPVGMLLAAAGGSFRAFLGSWRLRRARRKRRLA